MQARPPAFKTMQNQILVIATLMGERALRIYRDIKRFNQTKDQGEVYKFPTLKYKTIPTESNVCSKILQRKSKAFKCHDCIFESNSILCVECFEQSDHKGHIYEVIEVFGGCCDCGDEQKWDPKGFCKKHSNSNLVEEMKSRVNAQEEAKFIEQLSFCFVYWFKLYNESQLDLKKWNLPLTQSYKSLQKDAQQFGVSLLQFLSNFNKNSLISNIMTFNLLRSKIRLQQFQLQFCQQANSRRILEIILHIVRLSKCAEVAVNLFTQLFSIREFRKILTITFIKLHSEDCEFVMSDFNHLSCQLLTSHKMIRQLVDGRLIRPLVYRPNKESVKSFQQLARKMVRYYIDIEYLSKLYKDSSQKYLAYHIMQGQLTSIGYYKTLSFHFQQPINYYGIEEIGLSKTVRIMNVIKNSQQCLTVLQKGMRDLWAEIWLLYGKWNKYLFNPEKYEETAVKNVYLTYELNLALLVFTYFEKLDEKQVISEEQKINKLIQVLGLQNTPESIKKVIQTIEVVNSNLILAGLSLGHPETMNRFYTFFSFTFKKTFTMLSLTFYLYKILVRILEQLKRSYSLQNKMGQNWNVICKQFVFMRPLQMLKEMFQCEDYQDDDESIFDHNKNVLRLTFFLHMLIQASETDIHELILASMLQWTEKEKYEKMLNKFYLQILKDYNGVHLKQFKGIVDSFLQNNETFEKFISSSKQIEIHHGKISLKEHKKEEEEKQKQKEQITKIESEINLFYFRSFKNKLTNINENSVVFKVPTSQNHFLHQILSESFVDQLLQVLSSHIDIILINNGKIKERESASLGLLIVEIIKIGKAFIHKPHSKVPAKISSFFKSLQQKKSFLEIFTENIIKLICFESQQNNDSAQESMDTLNKEAQAKTQQRKRKLQNKKSKMLAKYKENQEKFEDAYAIELRKIRDEMEEENEVEEENPSQDIKTCIICRQNNEDKSKSDLMLMGFMQLTDLYEHFLKGKQKQSTNCHLVFKTCGHYVHKLCHEKTNKNLNQEYSICQLCKSSHNCLFPVSVSVYKDLEAGSKEACQMEGRIYKDLRMTYGYQLAVYFGLRDDCENGFGQPIDDDKEMKEKLLQSVVYELIFSSIVNKSSNADFFSKKQLQIYQNILYGLKIYVKGQLNQSTKQDSIKKNLQKLEKQREWREKLEKKIISEENKQKRRVIEIVSEMERYLTQRIDNFIMKKKQQVEFSKTTISEECLQILDYTFNKLVGQSNQGKGSIESEIKKEFQQVQFDKCAEIKLLREQVHFYTPPESMSKLIEMRGKCPNCLTYTNYMNICLLCQWKGCKGCQKQSLTNHAQNNHSGSSVYLDANVGNLYLVTKKKHWAYTSIYQDYMGECFRAYEQGVKLDKYTLNEHPYSKVKKIILDYGIDTTIRYEEYNRKRHFLDIV